MILKWGFQKNPNSLLLSNIFLLSYLVILLTIYYITNTDIFYLSGLSSILVGAQSRRSAPDLSSSLEVPSPDITGSETTAQLNLSDSLSNLQSRSNNSSIRKVKHLNFYSGLILFWIKNSRYFL